MSAPVLWIVFPAAVGLTMMLFLKQQRLLKWAGSITSFLLLPISLFQPIGNVLRIGGIVIDVKPELRLLGRALILENDDRAALMLLFGILFIFISTMNRSYFPAKIIPLSILITAVLISALAVQPFLYSAVLVEVAVLLMIPLVREKTSHLDRGILRFIIYLSLAMPFILLSGWLLVGVEASPGDLALAAQSAAMLGLGFAFLLAIFPTALNRISPSRTSPKKHALPWVARVTKYAPAWV